MFIKINFTYWDDSTNAVFIFVIFPPDLKLKKKKTKINKSFNKLTLRPDVNMKFTCAN